MLITSVFFLFPTFFFQKAPFSGPFFIIDDFPAIVTVINTEIAQLQ